MYMFSYELTARDFSHLAAFIVFILSDLQKWLRSRYSSVGLLQMFPVLSFAIYFVSSILLAF